MANFSPENSSANRKRTVDELILGRKFTYQLREMLKNNRDGHGPPSKVVVEDLAVKILESFNEGISILGSMDSGEVSQAAAPPGSPPCDGRKSEDSSGSCKTSSLKDGRGCYKRRKTCETTLVKDYQTLVDDGYAWRKYGQKVILNTPYPRNYYRCTHKFDQNCQATKQVQRIHENPPLYRTTYNGHHKCTNFQKCPQIIFDSTTLGNSSVLLCFGQNSQSNKETQTTTLIKEENKHGFTKSLYHVDHSHIQSSSSGGCPSSDDHQRSSVHWGPAVSSASEYGDVISSGCTHDLAMDMMDNVDVDDFTLGFLTELC